MWELFEKQNGKCALSNVDIFLSKRYPRVLQTASLDRIDNTKGYIKNNLQWVHKDINTLKTDFSMERFLELCNLVSEFNFKRDKNGK